LSSTSELDLTPFRRRIRMMRSWRCAAIGGSIGAAGAVILSALDYFDVIDATPRLLLSILGLGIVVGIAWALFESLPESTVARSVDRRAGLSDRLTTAYEVPASNGALAASLQIDARTHAESLKPAKLYPFKVGRWHVLMLALAALAAFVFLLGNTTWFRSAEAKATAAELSRDADAVQHIAMPVLEQAKRADATPEDKDLARQINQFASDLRKGRMTKQQALLKANELAAQALKLEQSLALSLAQSVQGAQTAAQKLEAMQGQDSLQKSDDAKLADRARSLSSQIAAMQQALAAAKAGTSKMSAAEKAVLEKKLGAAMKALQQIRLSQRAENLLRSLQSMPDYQEAQRLLAQLASQAQAQQAGDPSQMSAEQMQEIADRLDQLAKGFNTDAKMRELAREMMEAARQARLGNGAGLSAALLSAFGLEQSSGESMQMEHGPGTPGNGFYHGNLGPLNRSDKSSLLNVKFQDRQITSQTGKNGSETYTEVMGPSSLSGGSGVPYQAVLPKYEKSAESAIDKGDVPPQMRGKVRDYFNSLMQ